jgi:gluconolactonase
MMRPFRTVDAAFADVLGDCPRLVKVADAPAHEGPTYVADENALYVTSTPDQRHDSSILRLPLADDGVTLRRPVESLVASTDGANGMTLSADGALLVCIQGSSETPARIEKVDRRDGSRVVLVDAWRRLPLNSPNDVVTRRDGTVWFTDPTYGHLQGFRPPPRAGDHVYRYDPHTGAVDAVASDLDKPNGLAFSPDESVLYVADSGANQAAGTFFAERPHHVVAYEVVDGRRLGNRRVLADIDSGFPDGLKVDTAGRVYASAFDGVHVFTADGMALGRIRLPGAVNFCFGGRDGAVLYITTDTAVFAAVLAATGPAGPGRLPSNDASRPGQGALA